ncbi:16S rRNA (guanine(527)-N(7))-methyltransferase RsmG [Salidesulfovibrio onnuriiensis]|uniref:16S rRNA (guanine(527)-N(7))-methyltransferase RsmG n=1 Tax=Salidesulfovibrio onnuriiensis TaxID=2583823 RepID=UPI0011C73B02|nr:16S rRNA (guanine(527)-N(7))-methyltransferase RsmG [Salidesulfovibrio onnuriiensis]
MPRPTPKSVVEILRGLDLEASDEQCARLAAYLELLEKWNRKMNLVGPARWPEVLKRLVVDSIHLAAFLKDLDLPADPVTLDLGAGAGLPGIPLRMFWQAGQYWLVEVRQKRCGFMRTALGRLELPATHVFMGRAEDSPAHLEAEGYGHCADLILSKAFMPWRKLLDFAVPLLSAEGVLVILSNDPAPRDLPESWRLLGTVAYPVMGKNHHFWALSQSK